MRLWMVPAFGIPLSAGLYFLNHRLGGLGLVAVVFLSFIGIVFATTR
ncbi:MAG: hypothetical protein KJ904_10505 [Alphaproteobacteria bacterium]|nr:hypothetical protein [Alphaproteobacteria bacterium]MBU0798195.1 hypothetical protein [Alphaproteobacteria bacterium]MBU0887587.1 hypothetical protein [Alphaproteobacteria bacterium]MBU1814238.1 hypothetical protein [Alphaproteobacteria bacterium]MBU2089621.1 hypothetical protein [Alphaproteobacteria bacterium]